jgi:hypothetical protein
MVHLGDGMLKLRFTLFTGLLLAMLVACGSGDRTLNEADPDIVAQRPTFAQVYPIFQRDCIPCHNGTDEGPRERDDEDEDDEDEDDEDESGKRSRVLGVEPGLESCQSIINNLDDIVEDVFIDNNMPPGAWPRLTSKELLILKRWIDGGTETACD